MIRSLAPLLLLLAFSPPLSPPPRVKTGADVLVGERLSLVRGKRVGLITNTTGRLSSGEFLLDALLARGIQVKALFGPEHGIRGAAAAGESVGDTIDAKSGIPVYSLYGRTRAPAPSVLRDLDLLLYDIQDVGARFYTYISTLGLCMEAAAERGIPFVVLDRPNLLGGTLIDGPVLPDSLRSFVGMYPVPVLYGLTPGELAGMINGEGWLRGGIHASLTVVPMEGWARGMTWEQTGLPWIPPSPNIRRPETALLYPVTCYLEATNVSEGRGTEWPFHLVGAPFIRGADLARTLSSAGLHAREAEFTPGSSKFPGVSCSGVRLELAMSDSARPVRSGIALLAALLRSYPDSLTVNPRGLARLLGDAEALAMIREGKSAESIARRWEPARREFISRAARYLLYPQRQ